MRILLSDPNLRWDHTESQSSSPKPVSSASNLYLKLSYGILKIDEAIDNPNIVDLHNVNHNSDRYMAVVCLSGKSQKFEVDSGAKCSIIGERDFAAFNLNV